jgi:hypothetical protein
MHTNQFPRGISSVTNLFVAVILGLSAFLGPASTAVAAPAYAPLVETLTGSISGTVTEQATGDPLSGVEICHWDYDTGENFACTSTDSDGVYTLAGLPSGDYRIRAYKSGWSWQFHSGTTQWDDAARITVVDGQVTSNINFSMQPGGNISGYVYIAGGTTPIVNMKVEIVRSNGTGWPTCADSNGYYEFDSVPYGVAWRVEASNSGYNQCGSSGNYTPQYWDHTSDWDDATTLTVDAQTTGHTNINFNLELGGSISGTILDANSDPIYDAHICAYDNNHIDVNCARSDENGDYGIGGLPTGSYRISAWGDGVVRKYYNNVLGWAGSTPVSVTAGTTTSNIDFVLEQGGSISGHVYEADGVTPIAKISISLETPEMGRGTCTDENGAYTLNNVAYGVAWRASAAPLGDDSCGGPEGYMTEYWEETTGWDDATTLTLSSGTSSYSGIDFTLDLGGSVSGHIYETGGSTPVANAEVVIFINDVNQSITGVTADEQGYYIFNGIAPGNNYKIHARADGYLRAFHPDAASWSDAAWVSVQAEQTTSGVDIKLIKADSYITGRTTYEDGSPAANAWMEAFHEDGWFVGINANENGEFTIPVIAGKWRVFPHDLPMAAVEQSVSVTTGATISGINFILHPTGSISGIVYQSDGSTPLGNMALSLITATQEEGGWACSNANGQFTFEDVPYRVQWRVSAVPSWRCTGQPEGYKHEYWQDTNSWDDAAVITLSESVPNYNNIVFNLDQGETTSGAVGAGGGVVSTPLDSVSIEIPPAAVTEDITFTITDGGDEYQIATDTGGLDVVMSTTIGPEGTIFATPATLTFQWPDSDDNGIVDGTIFNEADLYLSKDGVVIAGPCSADTPETDWDCDMGVNQFTVHVTSLSDFVIGVPLTCYTLTLGHTGSGSNTTASPTHSTGCAAGKYTEGESISLSGAAPAAGWWIGSWTGTSNNSSMASTNSLVMPAGNRTVNVNYLAQRAKNGGFNTYIGTSKIPKYWSKSLTFASTDGKDTSTKKEGTASVRISGAAGKTKTLTQTLSLSGTKGQPFTFSYWVKASAMPTAGSCYGQVLFYYGTSLKGTKTLRCPTGATYTWKQVKLNLTAPATYNKVLIRFTYSKASGRAWFDLASLLR